MFLSSSIQMSTPYDVSRSPRMESSPHWLQWTIVRESDQSVKLTIGNFAYTGTDDQGAAVVASDDSNRDVKWHVNWRSDCNAYR